jgi:isocitrate/isopropylmalate dehydrogenase
MEIGLAVGWGTGPELAKIFERTITRIAERHRTGIAIARSPRIYHSYFSLKAERDQGKIRELTLRDAEHYENFCRNLQAPAIFRTAINAQSLYLVRQRLQAVKVEVITPDLLMIRDQAQGFYTGDNTHEPGLVTRSTTFSKEITEKILAFAVARARRQWPEIGRIVMAYKFHLLDGALDDWVTQFAKDHGVEIELCQPDTVNRNLIEHGFPPRTVLIASNEWADIMHVVLLDRFAAERQENRFTENVHLHPDVAGLTEYQTVHGSADDLAGRDLVNPTATLRAAAAIAERHAGCAGAIQEMERALEACPPSASTTEMVENLLVRS